MYTYFFTCFFLYASIPIILLSYQLIVLDNCRCSLIGITKFDQKCLSCIETTNVNQAMLIHNSILQFHTVVQTIINIIETLSCNNSETAMQENCNIFGNLIQSWINFTNNCSNNCWIHDLTKICRKITSMTKKETNVGVPNRTQTVYPVDTIKREVWFDVPDEE